MLLDGLALLIAFIYILERLVKHAAVWRFFRRPQPAPPAAWPSISLVQPITRSANPLEPVLAWRARLDYPGELQQILVYDAQDQPSRALIQQVCRQFPTWQPRLLPVQQSDTTIATKTFKMDAGLAQAAGEVICFIDDDIQLPPDGLQVLARHLAQAGVGAVFGLACYTNWRDAWSGLMSAFVNSSALLTYIPFTFFMQPFTITGHCFALRRQVIEAAGGLNDLHERLDDDHEIARRVRRLGLRLCQTPLVYQVDNALPSWQAYQAQMKRWFVFPRQMMLPQMARSQQAMTLLSSLGSLAPGVLGALALLSGRTLAWLAWAGSLAAFSLVYALEERQFLPARTPPARWPLVWLSGLLAPLQVLWALFSDNEIEWRGQRLHMLKNGRFERR